MYLEIERTWASAFLTVRQPTEVSCGQQEVLSVRMDLHGMVAKLARERTLLFSIVSSYV